MKLFEVILRVAAETSLNEALEILENCVTEKRLAWLDRHLDNLERSDNPLHDGLSIFYEHYLGLSMPRDGKIIEETEKMIILRWWNRCPTLEACVALGLDTREVCRKAYEKPVGEMMKRIDPRLRFDRNYDALRPYAPYCEEILSLTEIT